jgi:uncharacterized phage protein gp47/JayE
MNLSQTFESFLNQILLDYQGQEPDVDRSKATLVFIKSACVAGALWGLAQEEKNIARIPFPDQCDLPDLIHHATLKGIQDISSYIEGDGTFPRLVSAVLNADQDPLGAGNENDWEAWAKSCSYDHGDYIEHVTDARAFEDKRYLGSVDILVVSDRTEAQGGEQDPSPELQAAVYSFCAAQRSLGVASDFAVRAPTKLLQALTLQVSSGTAQVTSDLLSAVNADIVSFFKSLRVGDTYLPVLISGLAIARGLIPVSLAPDLNVPMQIGPAVYQRAWPDIANIDVQVAD